MILVAEPNLSVLKTAFTHQDYSDMLDSGRILFFTTLDRGELVTRLEERSSLMALGLHMAVHEPSSRVAPAFHREFQKLITEYAAYTRTSFMTLMLNNVTTCRNIANNLGRFCTTPPVELLEGAFRDRPAILVAAGPSLQKNMHLLHEAKGKAVIIAVQTMLKPLLAAGIEPDFVTSLDYNTVSTRFFENLEESGTTEKVHLVAEPKVNWNVLDVFDGTMSISGNDFANRLLREAATPHAVLKAGATVAHLSFYLAEYMGCEPIVLIGQDLGFVDGLYYKPGTAIHETWGVELGRFNTLETKEWERISRSKPILRKIPDIHGHPMYTEEQFFAYLQQFERDFAESRSTVIDATEGGARKQGVMLMRLREVIDRYCTRELSDIPRPWKEWSCDKVQRLQAAISALELRKKDALEMRNVCDATLPLLHEMIEKQHQPDRMRDLFVEVDRLRIRVSQDERTLEMAQNLNAIGELNRFKADLRVKLVEKGSMEHQKRQLERDVEYVNGLRVGCQRLLELVEDALERLKQQISHVRQGKKWPRNVAGSAN